MDEEKDKDKEEESVESKQKVNPPKSDDYFKINDYFDFAFTPEIVEQQKQEESNEDDIMLTIMRACIFFSRTLKPIISVIFIIIYWGSGLYRTNQIE